MAKTTSTGVFQLPNGTWGFRYAFMLDGKQKDIRRNKDENGNPFKTERAAIKAREATIIQVQAELLQPPKPTKKRMTWNICINPFIGRLRNINNSELMANNMHPMMYATQRRVVIICMIFPSITSKYGKRK